MPRTSAGSPSGSSTGATSRSDLQRTITSSECGARSRAPPPFRVATDTSQREEARNAGLNPWTTLGAVVHGSRAPKRGRRSRQPTWTGIGQSQREDSFGRLRRSKSRLGGSAQAGIRPSCPLGPPSHARPGGRDATPQNHFEKNSPRVRSRTARKPWLENDVRNRIGSQNSRRASRNSSREWKRRRSRRTRPSSTSARP